MIGKLISYGAAAALAAAPIAAQAAPERAAAPVSAEEELGSSGGLAIAALVLIGFIVALFLLLDSEQDVDVPFSP